MPEWTSARSVRFPNTSFKLLPLLLDMPKARKILTLPGPARRSRHHLALGTALCPGNGTTFALEAQSNQRQLVRSRQCSLAARPRRI
jgi:hypothetical protein